MKKILAITMLLVVTICCAFAFTACGSDSKLAMNKLYIREEDVGKEVQDSYIFHSNGTGEYTYHYDYESSVSSEYNYSRHYIIHFKYTYVDKDKSAVVCFYNSIERLEGDDGSYKSASEWSKLVTVSKNVLATVGSTSYVFWINEDYLDEIPNYRT